MLAQHWRVRAGPPDPAGRGPALLRCEPLPAREAESGAGAWFAISSTTNGAEAAAVSGGPVTFTLSPPTSFAVNDTVTVKIFAAQVTETPAPTQTELTVLRDINERTRKAHEAA